MERVINEVRRRLAEITVESVKRVKAAKIPYYEAFPEAALNQSIGKVLEAVIADLERGEPMACPALLAQIGALRAPAGVTVREMLRGVQIGFEVASETLNEVFRDDLEARLVWANFRYDLSYAGAAALAGAFVEAREQLIAQQNEQILKLSAPLVPLSRGVLLLPLVGVVTEARAVQIISSLLEAIGQHRTDTVIIDITGVPTVERSVIFHLLNAAQSARLMGARIVLVGVRPAMARAIVELGVDISAVATLGDLESGIAYALRSRGLAITKISSM